MIAMPHTIDGEPHMTIAEAVEFMGCTDGWVRALLREGKLRGRRLGERLWLVSVSSATEQRDALTTRAAGKRHLAKRPAAKRAKKKTSKRRK
jgi:excisionase family DNA binding protein